MATLKDLQPQGNCPKCEEGRFTQPRYETTWDGWESGEWLEWACDYCGYRVKTKTADAK